MHPWLARMQAFQNNDAEFDDDRERREAIVVYYGLCSFMDAQMGKVFDALESSGQLDNTLVIYCSDHGETLGMRSRLGKQVLYGESTRVPLIVAGLGLPSGLRRQTAVSLLDLPPTMCDALAVAPDNKWPGTSLLSMLDTEVPERLVFSEYHAVGSPTGGFMIANTHWKYHHYVDYPPELFHLPSDRLEEHNLAGLLEHAEVQHRMHRALLNICDHEQVNQEAKADQDTLVGRWGGAQAALKVGPKGASPAPG